MNTLHCCRVVTVVVTTDTLEGLEIIRLYLPTVPKVRDGLDLSLSHCPATTLYSFYCKSQKSQIEIHSKVHNDTVFNTSSVTTTYCHWFVHFRQVGPMDPGLGMEVVSRSQTLFLIMLRGGKGLVNWHRAACSVPLTNWGDHNNRWRGQASKHCAGSRD